MWGEVGGKKGEQEYIHVTKKTSIVLGIRRGSDTFYAWFVFLVLNTVAVLYMCVKILLSVLRITWQVTLIGL